VIPGLAQRSSSSFKVVELPLQAPPMQVQLDEGMHGMMLAPDVLLLKAYLRMVGLQN